VRALLLARRGALLALIVAGYALAWAVYLVLGLFLGYGDAADD
jgi:hypothetical protein